MTEFENVNTRLHVQYTVKAVVVGADSLALGYSRAGIVIQPDSIELEYSKIDDADWNPPYILVRGRRILKDNALGKSYTVCFSGILDEAPEWVCDFIASHPPVNPS